jgi:hypothetical protein
MSANTKVQIDELTARLTGWSNFLDQTKDQNEMRMGLAMRRELKSQIESLRKAS